MNPNHQNQLRSYIAPAAPATRAPCDGTEPNMRIEFGFTPRWFHEHCGIDFSEQWHLDPFYRRETLVAACKELNRRFPKLQLGGDDPDSRPASLDGVHGALLVAMIHGVPAEYYADNWPAAKLVFLDENATAALTVPDIPATPVMQQLLEQMDVIEAEHGRIEGYLNWQGVLNNAFRIRGETVLTDMVMNPDLAHHLFDVITSTMIAGMRLVYARQLESGVVVRHATVSNCVVNMISPELYREFLFPCDKRIAEAFDLFGIHNCAWNVDPYLEDYARIGPLGYIDMGLDSDLECARRLCPEARRAVMYKPTDLTGKSEDEIQADLERIHRELSPCDIVMADVDFGTDERRVIAFAKMAACVGK